MGVISQLPWSITAGWFVVIVWAAAQVIAWQRLRVVAPAPPRRQSSKRRSAARPVAPPPEPASQDAPEFLPELGLHSQDTTSAEIESVYR